MANIYDELAAANAQAQEEIARFGKVSDETSQRLARANSAIADFDAKVQSVTKAAGSLYQAFTTYNRAVTDGVKGYKDLASTTDQLATSIEALSAALAFVLPIGRIAKVAIAGLGLLAGELVRNSKIIGEQIDGLRAGFDELAQVGGTTAGGLTDMYEAMQKVGLSVKDFPGFAKALGEQSTLLSRFGGTVNDGRNAVLNLSDDLKPMRNELQNFGIRVEQIGEASLGFIKTQKLASLGSRTNMDISTKSMMSYVKELDIITRLTGISRKQQEKTMEEAMRNDAFAATLDDMRARGEGKRADMLMKNLAYYEKIGPTALKAYKDAVSGFVGTTDESAQLFQSSNGAAFDQIDQIKAGNIDTIEKLAISQKDLSNAFADTAETVGRGAAMLGTQFGLPYHELRNAIEGATVDVTKALGNIAKDQDKTDEILKRNNELLIKMQDDMQRNQALLQSQALNYAGVMDATTTGLSKLGDAAIEAAEKLGIIGGRKNVMGAVSSAVQGDLKGFSRSGGAEMVGKLGGAYAGAKGGAALGAGFGSAFGGIGAVPGALIGGALGAVGGYLAGGYLGERADEATGGMPSGQAAASVGGKTVGVNPTLLEKLSMAASELGKSVTITSGRRTIEEQAQMYKEWWEGGGKNGQKEVVTPTFGKVTTPARPGTSNHQHGNAVDINESLANELDRNGLLKNYGLVRPHPWDPVHIEMFENGGTIGAGKLGLVGENGKPEIVQGPATVSPNNDIMAALKDMVAALERSTSLLDRIDRNTMNSADTSDRMLRIAQN